MLWPPWGRGIRNILGTILLLACHWLEEKNVLLGKDVACSSKLLKTCAKKGSPFPCMDYFLPLLLPLYFFDIFYWGIQKSNHSIHITIQIITEM